MSHVALPPSVNFHILNACNYNCGFCFAVFEDSAEYLGKGQLPLEAQLAIVRQLAAAGVEKITFAGGEPTLSRNLPEFLTEAKRLGLVTMVVTNGSRLDHVGDRLYPHLDWLVLSVDSVVEETNLASGRAQRGRSLTPAELVAHADKARRSGVRIKLNTVVHQMNLDESMVDFVVQLRPERWKVFQVLPVQDQNGARIQHFRIDDEQFRAWLEHHAEVRSFGVELVSEANEQMRGTYAMIDPAGRFYDSSSGRHTYSEPILAVGIDEAFSQVTFARDAYLERGGIYDWNAEDTPPFVAIAGVSGAGKDTAAAYLVERGYRRIAIADALKRAAQHKWDLEDDQLWGSRRDVVDPRWGVTPRTLYQRLGDTMRAEDADILIETWSREVSDALEAGLKVVCPDVRLQKELDEARRLGAFTLLLDRPGAGAPGEAGRHATEREASAFQPTQFDAFILNDGSLGGLQASVKRALRKISPSVPARFANRSVSSNVQPLTGPPLRFTDHARLRMSQRGFSEEDVRVIFETGRESRDGEQRLFELEVATPADLLEVVVVVDGSEDVVVTVYRRSPPPPRRLASRIERRGFTLADAVGLAKRRPRG